MLPNWYITQKELIDTSIQKYLTNYFSSEKNPALATIKEATLYACRGGKRIRSILALEFFRIFSGKDPVQNENIIKFCIAVELLHAYSLVHDDLPAMDNDTLRRGELTTWKKFGETNAILVGDLLNSLSFELLANIGDISIIKYFGGAVGLNGMLGGQVLDLYYETNPRDLTLENLIETHNKKTGALIKISILGSLILANKEQDRTQLKKTKLEKYIDFGEKLGLAFQIQDDILDVEGTQEETGKSVGGEQKGFVHFLGLEKSKAYLQDVLIECRKIIQDKKSERLEFLIEYVGKRRK